MTKSSTTIRGNKKGLSLNDKGFEAHHDTQQFVAEYNTDLSLNDKSEAHHDTRQFVADATTYYKRDGRSKANEQTFCH